jgi:hypothetical protein
MPLSGALSCDVTSTQLRYRACDDPVMPTALLRLVALCVAALCVTGVVVSVVLNGTEGRTTDLLAVVAVAALVVAWRLHSRIQHETVGD